MSDCAERFPLSSPQEQIWFHQAFLPGTPLYNIGGCLRIDGALSTPALHEALRAVVAEADALRIVLAPGDTVPTQQFRDRIEFTVATPDFSAAADPERSAWDWMRADFARPFDLHDGPLFDFALVRLSETRHYWFHKYHHLIVDGWGISQVVQRVGALYSALVRGTLPEGNGLGSYRRFIGSELTYLGSPRYADDQRYWSAKLRELREPLARDHDDPAPSRHVPWVIERDVYDALTGFCRASDASLFHLLVAAICAYFARTTDRGDLLLGVPALNRRTPGEKTTVGLYAGLKPARLTFDPRLTPAGFLQRIRAELSRDYRHYRFPLARMTRGPGMPGRAPTGLFDVVLSFERHDYDATFSDHAVHMEALLNGFEQNGLAIFVRDYHDKRDVRVDFCANEAAFTGAEISGLVAGVETLLREMCAHPQQPMGRLNILSSTDRVRVPEWSRGPSEDVWPGCVHDWISQCARRHPERAAVSCGDATLSYAELDRRANGLAWRLRELGIGPETCVGIGLGRSPSLLIAVLAVLKAGGSYVPIDGSYPRERIQWMVKHARVGLVLCDRGELEWLPAEGVRLAHVDGPDETADEAPISHARPDNLVYVMYTSGSTGRPKGVMVSHRSLANYLGFSVAAYDLTAAPGVVPLHSSLGFDATVTSLLAPLLAGGCVDVLPGPNGLAALCEALCDRREYSLVKVTPSHLSVLEEELGRRDQWSKPRVVVLGGEALNDAALDFWRTRAPGTRIINEYGPTEAAVGCSVFEALPRSSGGTTAIGRPIWNTRLYVLDRGMEPVPAGAVGELYIGGAGLARGYVGAPGLTAERFVADPFGEVPGGRLYRSGDLARYSDDGTLEYIGRRDEQVKLRGHRVELGEVEAVVRTHPDVRDVAVRVDEDEGGHPRLVGYVVGANGRAPGAAELKRHARRWLPEVMVPAAWVTMERLPLTINGKVDRKQLPPASDAGRQDAGTDGEPRTELERELTAIWSQVLGDRHVGTNDNFFDFGGDSILALRIASRARAAGIEIGLGQIFKHQTVSALARVARRVTLTAPAAADEPVTASVPLSPIQHWLVEQDLPDANHFNQFIELEVSPRVDPQSVEIILDALAAHHPALRLRVRALDGEWMQHVDGLQPGGALTVEHMADIPADAEPAYVARKVAELHRSLNLSHGPLMRGLLIRRGSECPGRLFLAAHHAAIDVVSWRILLDDFDALHRQVEEGHTLRVAPETASFRQWAQRLVEQAGLPDVLDEAAHWLRLGGIETAILPRDGHGGENTVASADVAQVSLTRDVTTSLLSVARGALQCRVDEVLLAAVTCGIARIAGRHSILIDVESHGRDSPFAALDLSRTVGWFATLYPVHLTLPAGLLDYPEILGTIKRQLRQVPHGGHGYGLLRYLSPDDRLRTRLAALPRPELIFNYVGQIDRGWEGYGGWFRTIRSFGLSRADAARRPHALELDLSVVQGELIMQWTYSRHLHSRRAVDRLAQACAEELAAFVEHSRRAGDDRMFTPSDFPAARLDQNELDLFLGRFR